MEKGLGSLNALELAWLGDAVYELYVRRELLAHHPDKMAGHNRLAFSLVNAKAQAQALKMIDSELTDEERQWVRYGRNAAGTSSSKASSAAQYRLATGLECLLGALYLNKEEERLQQILARLLEVSLELAP